MYITRLASKEVFSPSKKIHREVRRAKDLSAPRCVCVCVYIYIHIYVCVCVIELTTIYTNDITRKIYLL